MKRKDYDLGMGWQLVHIRFESDGPSQPATETMQFIHNNATIRLDDTSCQLLRKCLKEPVNV